MRPFLHFISLAVLASCISACNKKNKKTAIEPVVPINREFVVAGDSSNMIVTHLNTSISYNRGQLERTRDFDFNNDNISDLTLYYYAGGTPAMQYGNVFAIPRNSALLHAKITSDSTFLNRVQTQSMVQDTIPSVATVTTQSCKRISSTDVLQSVKNPAAHVNTLSDGAVVDLKAGWSSDTVALYRDFYKESYVEMKHDTLFVTARNYDLTCTNTSVGKSFYLICRLSDKGETKLAWLKLKINNGGSIFVENAAIMK